MAVGTEVLYHKAVIDSIPHKAGEINGRNREAQFLLYKVMLDVNLLDTFCLADLALNSL